MTVGLLGAVDARRGISVLIVPLALAWWPASARVLGPWSQPASRPESTFGPLRRALPSDTTPVAGASPRIFERRLRAAVDSVRAASRVPVRVPRAFYGGDGDSTVYIVPVDLRPDRYELVFGGRPECDGGNACRDGSVRGWRRLGGAALPPGARVAVGTGARGVFTPATCGAFCSDAFVTWDEGPYRYRVGVKAGRLTDLRHLAAAIGPGP